MIPSHAPDRIRAVNLGDVIGLIDAAAGRFVLYRVDSIRTGTPELVGFFNCRTCG